MDEQWGGSAQGNPPERVGGLNHRRGKGVSSVDEPTEPSPRGEGRSPLPGSGVLCLE